MTAAGAAPKTAGDAEPTLLAAVDAASAGALTSAARVVAAAGTAEGEVSRPPSLTGIDCATARWVLACKVWKPSVGSAASRSLSGVAPENPNSQRSASPR